MRIMRRGEFRNGPIAETPLVLVAPAIMATVWRMTFEPLDLDEVVAAHLVLKRRARDRVTRSAARRSRTKNPMADAGHFLFAPVG